MDRTNAMGFPPFFNPFDEDNCLWVDRFSDNGLREFYTKFMRLEADPIVSVIPIIVSSYGGAVYVMLAMRDLIKSSSKPTATIALGKAMSCGASLLAAGTPGLRFASPDTHILIHEISSGSSGKTHDIKVETKYTVALNKLFLKNLADDTGKSVKAFQDHIDKLKNSDWMLTVTEAKRWGIIDHVGIPRIVDSPAEKLLIGGRPFTRDPVVPMQAPCPQQKKSKKP